MSEKYRKKIEMHTKTLGNYYYRSFWVNFSLLYVLRHSCAFPQISFLRNSRHQNDKNLPIPLEIGIFQFKKNMNSSKNMHDTHENFFRSSTHTLKARVTIILHYMNWHNCIRTKSWPPHGEVSTGGQVEMSEKDKVVSKRNDFRNIRLPI